MNLKMIIHSYETFRNNPEDFFVCPNPIFSTDREKKMVVGQPHRIPNVCDRQGANTLDAFPCVCPNPVFLTVREKKTVGRSTAQNSQRMRSAGSKYIGEFPSVGGSI